MCLTCALKLKIYVYDVCPKFLKLGQLSNKCPKLDQILRYRGMSRDDTSQSYVNLICISGDIALSLLIFQQFNCLPCTDSLLYILTSFWVLCLPNAGQNMLFTFYIKNEKKVRTRQIYNLFQDLWNRFIILEGSKCKGPLVPKLLRFEIFIFQRTQQAYMKWKFYNKKPQANIE